MALSLEDYPLVVREDAQQTPAAADTASSEPASAEHRPAALSRIIAESISLDSPVVEVGWKQVMQNSQLTNVWVVADYAAGWHKNSLLPGQGGNVVLSGHHNVKGEVFRYIVDLEPGAAISLFMDDQRFDYVVVDKFIVKDKGEPEAVRRENAKWVGPFNEERVTLVTCWPYNNNTHRVIVIAKPVDAADSTFSVNAVIAGDE
jgi:sortase A